MPALATAPVFTIAQRQKTGRPSTWTVARLRVVFDRYVVGGEPAEVVAADLGVKAAAMRKVVSVEGWKRSKAFEVGNRATADQARGGRPTKRKPDPAQTVVPALPPVVIRRPFTLHKTPVNWSRPVEDSRPLEVRILAALKARPLPAPTLAILIDAKEHYVAVQLAALAAAGMVKAGPAIDAGQRHRLWSAAA